MIAAELEHVTKSFGEVRALDDASFSVHAGDVVAVYSGRAARTSPPPSAYCSVFARPDAGGARLLGGDPRRAVSRRRSVWRFRSRVSETLRVVESSSTWFARISTDRGLPPLSYGSSSSSRWRSGNWAACPAASAGASRLRSPSSAIRSSSCSTSRPRDSTSPSRQAVWKRFATTRPKAAHDPAHDALPRRGRRTRDARRPDRCGRDRSRRDRRLDQERPPSLTHASLSAPRRTPRSAMPSATARFCAS